jgi:hypothetical protein
MKKPKETLLLPGIDDMLNGLVFNGHIIPTKETTTQFAVVGVGCHVHEIRYYTTSEDGKIQTTDDEFPNSATGIETIISKLPAEVRYIGFVGDADRFALAALRFTCLGYTVLRWYPARKRVSGKEPKHLVTAHQSLMRYLPAHVFTPRWKRDTAPVSAHPWHALLETYLDLTLQVQRQTNSLYPLMSNVFPECVNIDGGGKVYHSELPGFWTKGMEPVRSYPHVWTLSDKNSDRSRLLNDKVRGVICELAQTSLARALSYELWESEFRAYIIHYDKLVKLEEAKAVAFAEMLHAVREHPLIRFFYANDKEPLETAVILTAMLGHRTWETREQLTNFVGLAPNSMGNDGKVRINGKNPSIRKYLHLALLSLLGQALGQGNFTLVPKKTGNEGEMKVKNKEIKKQSRVVRRLWSGWFGENPSPSRLHSDVKDRLREAGFQNGLEKEESTVLSA